MIRRTSKRPSLEQHHTISSWIYTTIHNKLISHCLRGVYEETGTFRLQFAHAEVKKSNFSLRILELVGDTGIIFNDF